MDSRLVLTVLLATLSWMCLGTHAVAATTMQNMTGSMHNMTNNMTGPMHNMTGPMHNMTRPPMHNMTYNMTGPMHNMTRPPMHNMTNNMTGPMHNMTRPPMINGTTTTTAPPLMPNSTVEALGSTINRQDCRRNQLCAAQPSDCDPSTAGSCFFLGMKRSSGRNFRFQLSGLTDGYIAASLSPDSIAGGNDTTYICANDNGVVRFFGAFLNNGQLTPTTLEVNRVRGRINGRRIQCTFAATVPSPTARATPTNFAVSISTGNYNATTAALGNPVAQLRTAVTDLANPNSTVTNTVTNSTTNSTTTATAATTTTSGPATAAGHGVSLRQSLSQALLITLGVVGMALL